MSHPLLIKCPSGRFYKWGKASGKNKREIKKAISWGDHKGK